MLDPSVFHRPARRWLGEGTELAAPVLRALGRFRAGRPPSDPARWRRGLILGHSHIGDVLYRTCSLPQLSAALPKCRWSYLCAPSAAPLLQGNPAVAEVLPLMTGDDVWRLAPGGFAALRARRFDVVLCTNTLRHYPDLALAAALGVPARVGFAHKGLSGLLTRAAPFRHPSPFAAYFRSLVADVAGLVDDWTLRPRVHVTRGDAEAATAAWRHLGVEGGRPVVACALTTRQPHGNWPREHLLDALRQALKVRAFDVVLCGAADDGPVLDAAAAALDGRARVLAGALELRAFTAFLGRCDALLTLDTGTRHLGNAARIPVLFARNLLHDRVEAGAYCDGETDLAPLDAERLPEGAIARVVARVSPAAVADRLLAALDASGRRRRAPGRDATR